MDVPWSSRDVHAHSAVVRAGSLTPLRTHGWRAGPRPGDAARPRPRVFQNPAVHFVSRAPGHGRPRQVPDPALPRSLAGRSQLHRGCRLRGALCQPAGGRLLPRSCRGALCPRRLQAGRVGTCCPWSCRVHAGSGTVTGLPQLPQTPGAGARPLLPPSLVTAWEALPGADTRCRGVCPCTRAAPGAAARLVAASRGRRWPAEPDTGSALPGPCPPPLLVPEITFEWPVRGSPCDLHCVPLGSRDKRKAKL